MFRGQNKVFNRLVDAAILTLILSFIQTFASTQMVDFDAQNVPFEGIRFSREMQRAWKIDV